MHTQNPIIIIATPVIKCIYLVKMIDRSKNRAHLFRHMRRPTGAA